MLGDNTVKAVDSLLDFDPVGFPDRLRALIEPDSVRSFGRMTRIGASTLQKYLAGDAIPGFDKAVAIAAARGVDLRWLATGRNDQNLPTTAAPARIIPDGFVPVPRLSVRPSAGAGAIAIQSDDEDDVVAFREAWLRQIGVIPAYARLMVARGDSMADTVNDGDLIIVDTSIREVVDHGIYVLVYGGMVLLKRIQILRNRTLVLISDNPRYASEEVPPHEISELIVEGRIRWVGGSV